MFVKVAGRSGRAGGHRILVRDARLCLSENVAATQCDAIVVHDHR
jgi:hypothetical protein